MIFDREKMKKRLGRMFVEEGRKVWAEEGIDPDRLDREELKRWSEVIAKRVEKRAKYGC